MRHLLLLMLLFGLAATLFAAPAEEFVGPFPSWRNVKTDYGAVGDGVADDTIALQQALTDLQGHQVANVLYFPAGTYRITKTLSTVRRTHHEGMGITVIGEDPTTTILKWDGPAGGMMVKYDAWFSKISRLTLDGAGKAGTALAYGDAFSTYNETSDMVFKDVDTGMSMATGAHGQAENAVLRCHFLRCKGAGLRTNNFNSLDIWTWYCRFEDCGYGLYNGAGNFHAFHNLFLRSTKADIGTANLMAFSFINNTSIGSRCFLDFAGGHIWGSPTSITGNRIIEPTGDFAIRLGNGGPYFVADNIIRSKAGETKPAAIMTWGDQTFVGNTYTVENPVKEAGRFLRLAETVLPPEKIDMTPPKLPETPKHAKRPIIEVAPGADAAAIQTAIDQAAKLAGQRPVVHLPKGTYQINKSLTIPAGCDVQVIGDGAAETATVLTWTGPAGGVLLTMKGPSQANIRDLSITAPNGHAIRVEGADQPGGTVYANQLSVAGMNDTWRAGAGLLINGVEQSDVLAANLQGGAYCRTWVRAVGGARRVAGKAAPGQATVIAGATGSADAQYAVERGARLVVRSVYHEMSGDAPQGVLLNDRGVLSIDATRFSYKTSAEHPLIEAKDFNGQFTLLTNLLLPVNSTHTARVEIKGDGAQANLLCMNNIFWVNELGVTADKVWRNIANPPAKGALLYSNMNSGTAGAAKMEKGADGFAYLNNCGTADEPFILHMLQPLRESRTWLPETAPKADVTRVLFHRVLIATGQDGIGVELRAGE